jgi:hypothetical protein
MWFGSNCEGFQAMYIGPGYLQQLDDGTSNDENNEDF